jgi:hypothetical protein
MVAYMGQWLAVTVAFVAVGVMLWRRHPLARRATVVAPLALLAFASDRLVLRPNT